MLNGYGVRCICTAFRDYPIFAPEIFKVYLHQVELGIRLRAGMAGQEMPIPNLPAFRRMVHIGLRSLGSC
jgi:hypothetical protein